MIQVAGFTPQFLSRNRVAEEAMSGLTTFRIGGPAAVVTLESRADLAEVLGRGCRWLGKGANLLVGDAGVREPVVRLGADFAAIRDDAVRGGRRIVAAGAAVDLAKLIAHCINAGLAGPEGLAGVPASVGGALRMNAGTPHCWIMDLVARVEAVLPGEDAPRWIERQAIAAAYRHGGLPAGALILGCELALEPGDPAALRERGAKLKKAKADSQPLALPSAGCTFKNPSKEQPAGRLIDELGLKGTRIGGAEISRVHANFIVNPERNATAGDVVRLVRRIRRSAWRERGVALDMEVEAWACPDELRAPPADLPED